MKKQDEVRDDINKKNKEEMIEMSDELKKEKNFEEKPNPQDTGNRDFPGSYNAGSAEKNKKKSDKSTGKIKSDKADDTGSSTKESDIKKIMKELEGKGKEIRELEEELAKKEEQFKELSDRFLRQAAEYDNFRRRSQAEKNALYSQSINDIACAWLTVIDDMERGIEASSGLNTPEAKKLKEGMQMVLSKAVEVMGTFGIKEIDALGQTFDPRTMEAVMHGEDENLGENEVAEVFTKGYISGDKVIRHAIVRVVN